MVTSARPHVCGALCHILSVCVSVCVCVRARAHECAHGQLGISVVLIAACPHVLSCFFFLSCLLSFLSLLLSHSSSCFPSALLSCGTSPSQCSVTSLDLCVCPPTLATLFTFPPHFILWGRVEAFVPPQPFSQPRGSSERPGGLFEERDPWGTKRYGEGRDVVLSPES